MANARNKYGDLSAALYRRKEGAWYGIVLGADSAT